MKNVDVVERVCRIVAKETGRDVEKLLAQRTYVTDRPGHDHRYAIDASKIARDCGFTPRESFDTGLEKTVRWYLENTAWIEDVQSGAYRAWTDAQYGARTGEGQS
jgi:dTDP-glucose 4,6-dehydratase